VSEIKYTISKHSNLRELFSYWEDGFNFNELNYLQQLARSATQDGMIGMGSGGQSHEVRRSQVEWLHVTDEHRWVYDRLSYIIAELNANYFHFDITGFGESIQLTNYNSNNQGTYQWHQDAGGTVSRKLSIVLQLSDPSEYEGGNLQFFHGSEPITVPKKRGFIVVFPSWLVHQVTPVTQGTRQSLVSWITGPQFR